MLALRSVILLHTTADGVHHDWLIEDPRLAWPQAPEARLWTARLLPPPTQWAQLGRFELSIIPPHRRAYFHYQGAVSGDRGRVRKLASAVCLASLWTEGRIVMQCQIDRDKLLLDLNKRAADLWIARVTRA